MGVGKEIERLRREDEAAHNRELEQKRELVEGINALYERHEEIARDYARPFVQKLRESGAIGVLEDLRESMDLHYYAPKDTVVTALFGREKRKKRIDPTPAKLRVFSEVQVGPRGEEGRWICGSYVDGGYVYWEREEIYAFFGLNLKLESRPKILMFGKDKVSRADAENYELGVENCELDFLQRYFQDTSARDSKKVNKCYAELVWDCKENVLYDGSEGHNHQQLRFYISRDEQGVYMLRAIAGRDSLVGDSLPEQSWSVRKLEQVVAKAYVEHLTDVFKRYKEDWSR